MHNIFVYKGDLELSLFISLIQAPGILLNIYFCNPVSPPTTLSTPFSFYLLSFSLVLLHCLLAHPPPHIRDVEKCSNVISFWDIEFSLLSGLWSFVCVCEYVCVFLYIFTYPSLILHFRFSLPFWMYVFYSKIKFGNDLILNWNVIKL